MKNFIIRYLITYLMCTAIYVLDVLFFDFENKDSILLFLIWFLLPANLVSSLIFYFLLKSISSKVRKIILILIIISLIAFYVPSAVYTFESNLLVNLIKYFFIFCVLVIPQLLVPNVIFEIAKYDKIFTLSLLNIKYLHHRLEKLFTNQHPEFQNFYKVFFLADSSPGTAGVALLNSQLTIVFTPRNPATTVHELLHAVGLPHSWESGNTDPKVNGFVFEKKKTDNVMDYSATRYSLWKWQWKKLQSKSNSYKYKP